MEKNYANENFHSYWPSHYEILLRCKRESEWQGA